ncbi:ADP-ribosylation/crystallin J1 [Bauldia sp.]|uniref:ADP-ribosylation/crystallin J1 n=1 Tax=Bauldia sp. TaxID=2575872 RepID=UPI003BACC869
MTATEADAMVPYRPVGPKELKLIEESCFSGFPPRLPEQPIFYPVTNEAYATQIARDWNTRFGSNEGFVTRFTVKRTFLDQFDRKIVGGREHEEYWIPAERLREFNDNIVGKIEVIAHFVREPTG